MIAYFITKYILTDFSHIGQHVLSSAAINRINTWPRTNYDINGKSRITFYIIVRKLNRMRKTRNMSNPRSNNFKVGISFYEVVVFIIYYMHYLHKTQ